MAIVAYLSDTCDVTECGLLEDSYYVFETDCVTSFDIPDGCVVFLLNEKRILTQLV